MLKLDQLIIQFDQGLRTLFAPAQTVRSYPDENVPDVTLSDEEKRHAAALMRINHVGEVCAQALYQGQALTARNLQTREALRQAARLTVREPDDVVTAILTNASLAAMDITDARGGPPVAPLLNELEASTRRAAALYAQIKRFLS